MNESVVLTVSPLEQLKNAKQFIEDAQFVQACECLSIVAKALEVSAIEEDLLQIRQWISSWSNDVAMGTIGSETRSVERNQISSALIRAYKELKELLNKRSEPLKPPEDTRADLLYGITRRSLHIAIVLGIVACCSVIAALSLPAPAAPREIDLADLLIEREVAWHNPDEYKAFEKRWAADGGKSGYKPVRVAFTAKVDSKGEGTLNVISIKPKRELVESVRSAIKDKFHGDFSEENEITFLGDAWAVCLFNDSDAIESVSMIKPIRVSGDLVSVSRGKNLRLDNCTIKEQE